MELKSRNPLISRVNTDIREVTDFQILIVADDGERIVIDMRRRL